MSYGSLYIVATPIGNLEDITLRALRVLGEVSLIAAEDTRRTRGLLAHFDIHTPLASYHDHNKEDKAETILARIKGGGDVALVSDAGTPGISDPGYYLVNRAIEEGVAVAPVPGPAAALAALSASGLPTDSFVFEGFLPPRRTRRRKELEDIRRETRTVVFYEAPHRIRHCLKDMVEVLGDRRAALARELTKVHEEIVRGTLSGILEGLGAGRPKGEITLVVEGARSAPPPVSVLSVAGHVEKLIREKGFTRKDAVAETARALSLPRKAVYNAAHKKDAT